MSLNAVSFLSFKSASSSRDWTQQELAEFYRVETSLIRANIPIETDRGRSDEGDPWFVFCNANSGEVIVHFAQFDGTYVVASPALGSCARGRDFRALIEAQIASHPLVIPKRAGGGKLFIHPAALLIVLVTTYFFKLSQTTAVAGELHKVQLAHPGVGFLSHSNSGTQPVIIDEGDAANVLTAIATGIALTQSHDFSLRSIGAPGPTKIDASAHDFSVSTLSNAAGAFDAKRDDLFHPRSPAGERGTPFASIGGDPYAPLPGNRLLNGPDGHSAAAGTFSSLDTSMLAVNQTRWAVSGPPSSAESAAPVQTAIMPISVSTVSSGTTGTVVSSGTTDATVSSGTTGVVVSFETIDSQVNIHETADVGQEIDSSPSAPIIGVHNVLPAGTTPTQSIFAFGGAAATYALTSGHATNDSLGHSGAFAASDLITGVINASAGGPVGGGNTVNAGDALVLSGATLGIVDIRHPATKNELAGLSLTGPFKFVVNELAAGGGSFDFTLASGATNVESLNSIGAVNFTNLAAGTNVEISGSVTPAGTIVNVTYASPTAAESFQVDDGVSGVSFETLGTSADAPTSEAILSTGAVNGTGAQPDWFHITNSAQSVTSLTVRATTSLVAGLSDLDFNATAGATTLTVSGPATLVDLTQEDTDAPFAAVSASGLTNGALHLNASNVLTTFTGGGGGNELLYGGEDLSASATAIDGGGGTGNILSAQLANSSNGGIFTNWQILDITQYQDDTGLATFDASALLTNDVISGVQLSGADVDAETVLNIAPAATVMVTGTGFTDAGLMITHSSTAGDNLAVTLNNIDTAAAPNNLSLSELTSTGDTTISIASTGATRTAGVGYNGIGTLVETDGHLAKVTVTGDGYFYLGYLGGVSTDSDTISTASITSALSTIDASPTTGGVSIYAGNSTLDLSGFEVSYKGLQLDGGSGPNDVLYSGATDGVTIELNGQADRVWLGGSNASGVLGTGAADVAVVGNSAYATAVTPSGPEAPGSALGDSVTFKAGATAKIVISGGAEWDGATYVGGNPNNGVGQTTVVGAVAAGATTPGTLIDLSHIVGAITNIHNAQTSIVGASNLTAAENAAVAALGGVGVAYFTYGSNEFLVAAHAFEGAVSFTDAVVELLGVNITSLSMIAGIAHLV